MSIYKKYRKIVFIRNFKCRFILLYPGVYAGV